MIFSPSGQTGNTSEPVQGGVNEEFYEGEEIDIWPILKEILFLSLPIKTVCKKNCRGLCPNCGQDLNAGDCDCFVATGHPGMAVLKQLKDKLKVMDS